MTDVVERLELLEQTVLDAAARADPPADGHALATAARGDAAAVMGADGTGALVARRFVATALVELALARAIDPSATGALLDGLDGAERLGVELAAVAHPTLAALPLPEALEAVSMLLAALVRVTGLSAWRTDLAGRVVLVHEHGHAPAAARAIAKRCLVERAPVAGHGGLFATPVRAFNGVAAALVWRADTEDAARPRLLVAEAATGLAAPLQHALTADDNLDAHRALVQAPERRLTRLALDIHDGALQDAALVAGEVRRLEDELRPALKGHPEGERVRGRLETLASLVAALDSDLREVATTFEGPSVLKRPFDEAVEAAVSAFRTRTLVDVALDVSGDLDVLTDSQRITLFRVIQESLANVRQHADARAVAVTVASHATHVEAEVVDDGVGFELEAVVDRAGRSGRLGLVGMVERVRLLGGRCVLSSRPGHGTSVRVTIARYEPLAGDER